ncbi:MAG TPA: class I SAM-dependent methyltransferase [Clostridia bacterium]|nr:class I SAM-dependent methyltransferase [Clostridia bacterium]
MSRKCGLLASERRLHGDYKRDNREDRYRDGTHDKTFRSVNPFYESIRPESAISERLAQRRARGWKPCSTLNWLLGVMVHNTRMENYVGRQLTRFTAEEGTVEVEPLPGGRFRVTLKPNDPALFLPRASCETSLEPDIIWAFLQVSFVSLCDSLARHDDPAYLKKILGRQLFAYFDAEDFRGKRLLDFGCGSGASTFCLAAMLPKTEIVGVELNPSSLALAQRVLAARGLQNIKFAASPNPNSLPTGLGSFDFITLSATYEHMLPEERRRVMPLLWSCLNYGGVLFINQTPHRYFPYEGHSTGLWFINYLPDRLALYLARNHSRLHAEGNRSRDWNAHLRGGIRGATEMEIIRNLRRANTGRPVIVQPRDQDRAAYWLSMTNPQRHRLLKKGIAAVFRLTDRLWGTVPSANVDVAIRKDPIWHLALIFRDCC